MLKIFLIAAATLCAAAPALAQESASDTVHRSASSADFDLSSSAGIAAPGTPIRVAEAELSRAGFYCHGGRAADGVVSCSRTSVIADSGNDSQHEVTLRVQITADPSGAVAAATVHRNTDGV